MQDELPDSYFAAQPAIFRTGFQVSSTVSLTRVSFTDTFVQQLLPRWEAYACLAYSSAFCAEEPLRNQQMAVPVIVNLEMARQASDWYDAAASSMPFDWHQKRDILWAGLRL